MTHAKTNRNCILSQSYFFFLSQVPLSKWDKVSGEEEQDKEESSAQDALSLCVPPPLVVPTNQETERENEQKRWRSVDTERNRDSQMQRGRYIQKESRGVSSINRAVAPSSGKYRTDSTLCTDRGRERKMELEGWRDRDRRRETERPRDRQKENKRSKEKMREEDRWRYWGSEREHSSTVSDQRRNHSSSGPYSSTSESNYFHPSGKVSGSERKERSSISRAVEVPDKNAHKTHREASVDSKSRDRNLSHGQHSHQDPSRNYHHQDRPAGTHHSTASSFHTQGKDLDPLSSESFGLKPRMSSPGWELMQNRSRDESKEEKGEWKLTKVDKVIRESKCVRETREMEAEREGGSQWVSEANKLAVVSKWEERRELEEGERSSSRSSNSSSSASLENKEDDRRKGRKKHKKHRKEKRQAVPELLEEMELKKHKKSKKHLERRKEESGGEVDDGVKEEEDHTRLFSVMLS